MIFHLSSPEITYSFYQLMIESQYIQIIINPLVCWNLQITIKYNKLNAEVQMIHFTIKSSLIISLMLNLQILQKLMNNQQILTYVLLINKNGSQPY